MCTRKPLLTLMAVLVFAPASLAQQGFPTRLDLGAPVTPSDLEHVFAIPPDGCGLPPGKGSYAEGRKIYENSCTGCHGDKLQGVSTAGLGGDKLIGGRGT